MIRSALVMIGACTALGCSAPEPAPPPAGTVATPAAPPSVAMGASPYTGSPDPYAGASPGLEANACGSQWYPQQRGEMTGRLGADVAGGECYLGAGIGIVSLGSGH